MIDSKTQALLQDILARESSSMLLYVGEAFPWTTVAEQPALQKLLHVIDQERHWIGRLAEFMVRHRVPLPPLGAFPLNYTTINFLSFDYLLPRLLTAQDQSLAALEADLSRVHDIKIQQPLHALLEMKRRNRNELEALAKGQAQALAGAS